MSRSSLVVAVLILVLAAGALAIRLPRLAMRPMHGDEANQAVKAKDLWMSGDYRYDPEEHHGPSLYWITLPSLWLSGAEGFSQTTEFDYRIVPVIFGVGLILLLPLVADGLGRGPTVIAGLLTAISPAMVFYSRYYVQEMLLVFFTFAAIAFGWRWFRSRSLGWAAAFGAAIGLMHATKETWVIAGAAMGAGVVLTTAAFLVCKSKGGQAAHGTLTIADYLWYLAGIVAALAVAVVVTVALYSSFGAHWNGPLDSILAYATYWRRGTESGIHTHPWYYYLELLVAYRPARGFFWTEGLIVGLAAVGCVASIVRFMKAGANAEASKGGQAAHGTQTGSSAAFCLFLAVYTLVLTALYAFIRYKTPWCLLSFFHGMILLAGLGAWELVRWMRWRPFQGLVGLLLLAGAAHLGRECYLLNFRFAVDQRNPWVYAHPFGDVLNLAAQMERLAQVSPDGHEMMIHVVTPENYWPLPWYLRQFNRDRVGFWQDPADWAQQTGRLPPPSVIVLTEDVEAAAEAHFRAAYFGPLKYGLRHGQPVIVYVRQDLWEGFQKAAEGSG